MKSAVEFSKLQMQQDFFYEGIDRDTFGRKLAYAIPKSNLAAFEFQGRDDYRKRKDEVGKEVTVIVGPPTLLDRLQRSLTFRFKLNLLHITMSLYNLVISRLP